jgi:hypothetical protein
LNHAPFLGIRKNKMITSILMPVNRSFFIS